MHTHFFSTRSFLATALLGLLVGTALMLVPVRADAQTMSRDQMLQQLQELTQLVAQLQAQLQSVKSDAGSATADAFTSTAITVGNRVQTTDTLRVRSRAGVTALYSDTVSAAAEGIVVGGPEDADGYTWWQIEYDNGMRGWSAGNWLRAKASQASLQQPSEQNSGARRSSIEPLAEDASVIDFTAQVKRSDNSRYDPIVEFVWEAVGARECALLYNGREIRSGLPLQGETVYTRYELGQQFDVEQFATESEFELRCHSGDMRPEASIRDTQKVKIPAPEAEFRLLINGRERERQVAVTKNEANRLCSHIPDTYADYDSVSDRLECYWGETRFRLSTLAEDLEGEEY